jgi:hypothetical protein
VRCSAWQALLHRLELAWGMKKAAGNSLLVLRPDLDYHV